MLENYAVINRVNCSFTLVKLCIAVLPAVAAIAHMWGYFTVVLGIAALTPALAMMAFTSQAPEQPRKDPKTGLCDAETLGRHLDQALASTNPAHRSACIILSIDSFGQITRDWGDVASRDIAEQVTDRITGLLRSGDVITRISQDCFAIVLTEIRAPELGAVIALIERLQTGASAPIGVDDTTLHVSLSAGFCLGHRAPSRSANAMLDAAEMALDDAIRAGHGNIRAYSENTPKLSHDPQDMVEDILAALQEGQIKPWFQPQISTDTGQITGFEALARWDHPDHGIIPPCDFLPALEAADRMEDLSETMLRHSLKAIKAWDKMGIKVPSVAVNFATQELRNPNLVERIKWDVDRFELSPERLTVEILETVVSEGSDDVITRNIRALKDQGFRIDLDDFGTGHASLANIRRFAVDRVKIDRSFVMRADDDPEQQRMISAIVSMAERLEIETLAEGVETIGEQGILAQLGCTHLQGFSIAKPMPFEDTIEWIATHQTKLSHTPRMKGRAG